MIVYTLFRTQLPCSRYMREVKDNTYKVCHNFPWVGNTQLTEEGLNEYQNPPDLEGYMFQFKPPIFLPFIPFPVLYIFLHTCKSLLSKDNRN